MNRNELTEMIRQEIRSLAFEELREKAKQSKTEKSKAFKPKGLSEEELEQTLFHGGEKPEEKNAAKIMPITIKENYNSGIPQIQSSEVTNFEDSFEEMLKEIDGASVIFDKQSNGYSLKMSIGPEGIEAGASGSIEMGKKGRIIWAYSLKNGLVITTEDLSVDKGNRNVIDKLYSNYDAWQKDWREKLTITPGQQEKAPQEPSPAPQPPAGGETEAPPAS